MAKESVGVVDGRNADLGLVGELSIPENGYGEYLDIDWRSPVFGRIISGVVLDSLPEKDIGIRLEVEEDSSGGFERTAWWEAGGGGGLLGRRWGVDRRNLGT